MPPLGVSRTRFGPKVYIAMMQKLKFVPEHFRARQQAHTITLIGLTATRLFSRRSIDMRERGSGVLGDLLRPKGYGGCRSLVHADPAPNMDCLTVAYPHVYSFFIPVFAVLRLRRLPKPSNSATGADEVALAARNEQVSLVLPTQ